MRKTITLPETDTLNRAAIEVTNESSVAEVRVLLVVPDDERSPFSEIELSNSEARRLAQLLYQAVNENEGVECA